MGGELRFEASMDEQFIFVVKCDSVSVAADGGSFDPLGLFSIVYFHQGDRLVWIVGSAAHNQQHTAHEAYKVLIAAEGSVGL